MEKKISSILRLSTSTCVTIFPPQKTPRKMPFKRGDRVRCRYRWYDACAKEFMGGAEYDVTFPADNRLAASRRPAQGRAAHQRAGDQEGREGKGEVDGKEGGGEGKTSAKKTARTTIIIIIFFFLLLLIIIIILLLQQPVSCGRLEKGESAR